MTEEKKLDSRHVEHWQKQPGFVYFIGAGAPAKAVKIGISTAATIKKRLRTIQTSNHEPLILLGLVAFDEGAAPMAEANKLELELHERFGSARRFSSGPGNEWFNATEELLSLIDDLALPPETFNLPSSIAVKGPGLEK